MILKQYLFVHFSDLSIKCLSEALLEVLVSSPRIFDGFSYLTKGYSSSGEAAHSQVDPA